MLLASTPDHLPPMSRDLGHVWGVLPSPAPECCCVQMPFRLSQIWSLNEEEKGGKKPKKPCWKLSQTSHLLFTSTFQHTGLRWDQYPCVPEGLPWLRAGRDRAATRPFVVAMAALPPSVILRLSQSLVCRHKSQGLPLKLNLADVCFEFKEKGELMVLPWVRARPAVGAGGG